VSIVILTNEPIRPDASVSALRTSKLRLLVALASSVLAVAARAADSNLGRDVAANCASCHAISGPSHGQLALASLAGRDANDIARIVREFRDGRRPSTVMQQLAKGYTDTQIDAAAAYLAAQKPP
jgi:cytochrome subunit of sulfide dehydrogenase